MKNFISRKYIFILFFLSPFLLALVGRVEPTYGEISKNSAEKHKIEHYVPKNMKRVPGGKSISISGKTQSIGSFSIDASCITNAQYKEFLEFVKESLGNKGSTTFGTIEDSRQSSNEDDDDDEDDDEDDDGDSGKSKQKRASRAVPKQRKIRYSGKDLLGLKLEGIAISPDVEAWKNLAMSKKSTLYDFLDTLSKNYFFCEAYENYPIVCISYDATVLFANWRTKKLNEYRSKNGLSELPEFRLPTAEEYSHAARGGYTAPKYSCGGPLPREVSTGKPLINVKMEKGIYGALGYVGPSPVGVFKPNKYGLYDMSGNVATRIADGGYMGGSWRSTSEAAKIGVVHYNDGKADPGVGIRLVMSAAA